MGGACTHRLLYHICTGKLDFVYRDIDMYFVGSFRLSICNCLTRDECTINLQLPV
jgi:hypothetical protein